MGGLLEGWLGIFVGTEYGIVRGWVVAKGKEEKGTEGSREKVDLSICLSACLPTSGTLGGFLSARVTTMFVATAERGFECGNH